jgi:FKBP-type peptidyl-prolyl cis-trans isomerase SlyD
MSKKVIGFHYHVKDKEGSTIDSSEGAEALYFLEGVGQIIPGLEKELTDMATGDKKNIVIAPAEAYGEVIDDLVITVNKSQFPEDATINVGDTFQVSNEPDAPLFTVKAMEGEEITLDGNHPLAGQELHFDVEITEVRDATEEEIQHGHAHAPGGHTH